MHLNEDGSLFLHLGTDSEPFGEIQWVPGGSILYNEIRK